MPSKYIYIFQPKAVQNLPKLGFLVPSGNPAYVRAQEDLFSSPEELTISLVFQNRRLRRRQGSRRRAKTAV
jgi:hypothetical protein